MTVILGIVAIFEALVIVYLIFSKARTYSGVMRVTNTPESIGFQLELDEDPAKFEHMDEVKFKVVVVERVGNTD